MGFEEKIVKNMPNSIFKLFRKILLIFSGSSYINKLVNTIAKKIKKIMCRGSGCICLICGVELSNFYKLPFNEDDPRFGELECPYCGTSSRIATLYSYLKHLDIFNNENFSKENNFKVLHFAPEKHFYDEFKMNPQIEYYGVDLCPEQYKINGMDVKKVDITNIPYDNDTFDFILANHVLEHVPDDKKAMSELYRVLKLGGGEFCKFL
ncbi:MAG: class I SAM-dependent methyltransferase [Methanobrevibacter sp.]|jgi:SAM-dependent methyltransferase|nr:class I SAM-dependent methyltransferase [Candidatus Methanoflexus mossambicus]